MVRPDGYIGWCSAIPSTAGLTILSEPDGSDADYELLCVTSGSRRTINSWRRQATPRCCAFSLVMLVSEARPVRRSQAFIIFISTALKYLDDRIYFTINTCSFPCSRELIPCTGKKIPALLRRDFYRQTSRIRCYFSQTDFRKEGVISRNSLHFSLQPGNFGRHEGVKSNRAAVSPRSRRLGTGMLENHASRSRPPCASAT